jgi:MFS family permease
MTEVRARRPQQEQQARRTSPYLELLRTPGALGFSAAGFVGRMPMAMFGLGTVLLIASITGQYGLAGIVAAVGSVSYAICAPQVARLTDRVGQNRVLRPLVAVFTVSTIAFVTCAELRAPLWALLAAGALAGASMPSLGSMVRARWSVVAGGDTQLMHTAFALESVADELIFVIGPALVTVLATEVYPAAGVIVAAVLCVTGTLLFAAQRRTQPAPRPRPRVARAVLRPAGLSGGPAGPSGGPAGPSGADLPPVPRARRAGMRIPAPGLIILAPVYLFVGAMFATIDLSTVKFAQEHGHKPLAGFILGTYALGSATGGLWYGSRTWRAALHRRFAVTLCCTVAGVATFWAMPGLLWLAVVVFFSGLTISPTLIAGYGLVERQAPVARRTEGMAWLSSTISVGVAAGSAIAGHLLDVGGARQGYIFAACCGTTAAVICLLGLRRLGATSEAEPSQWAHAEL